MIKKKITSLLNTIGKTISKIILHLNINPDLRFEYKNKSGKYELKKYERTIRKNLTNKISQEIIKFLYSHCIRPVRKLVKL